LQFFSTCCWYTRKSSDCAYIDNDASSSSSSSSSSSLAAAAAITTTGQYVKHFSRLRSVVMYLFSIFLPFSNKMPLSTPDTAEN